MRVLVTGGAGFIGANFVLRTLDTRPDTSIRVLDKLTYAANPDTLAPVADRVELVEGDITDAALVDRLVAETDLVVHFAAESHNDNSLADPSAFVSTNLVGTYTLLEAVRAHRVRYHHISTDEVYGDLDLDDPARFTETTAYNPSSPYSSTKAGSDLLVRAWVRSFGVAATISNCSNNYGPYHFPEKMIPLFVTNLLEGKKVPVYGDGGQVRDWVYVEDHVRGVDLVLRKGKIGETYLFGGNSEITNLELTKKLIALCGRDEGAIEFVTDRPGHDRRYAIDHSKAKRELGWEPKIGLDEGLKRTVKWFKENKEWVARSKQRV